MPATVTRQLDFVFASNGLADTVSGQRAERAGCLGAQ